MSLSIGQQVEINGHIGRVASVWSDFLNRKMATIEFDNSLLDDYTDFEVSIERIDTFGKTRKFSDSERRIGRSYYRDTDQYCPRCDTPWTVTKFGNNVWYDCKVCKKKKEDII